MNTECYMTSDVTLGTDVETQETRSKFSELSGLLFSWRV